MSTLLVNKNTRYLTIPVMEDLKEKMVFLGGPRQVGKTTFSQCLIKKYYDKHPAYLNWDYPLHREKIKTGDWPKSEPLIVLDEIHKYKNWRNLVKGFYDTQKNTHSFLITGSARLDYYRKGGDSLLGRYHFHRMHPFSLSEIGFHPDLIQNLLKFGGFPEPLFKQSERTLRRWQRERLSRVVGEDLRDLEKIREISLVEQLAEMLPDRVGAPLSIKNLAGTLEVDFKTAKRWISILENLFYVYQIAPFGAPKVRAVKKEQKLYMWDWSQVLDLGYRFENMVASHLLKYCHTMEDQQGFRMELRFLRDVDQREVDFVVLKDKVPLFAVECKTGEKAASPALYYFSERTQIPKFYQVHLGTSHRQINDKIEVIPFVRFCKEMNL